MPVPAWIETFLLVGVLFVVVAVPVKILWEATRRTRERRQRAAQLADRLREHFSEVRLHRPWLGEDEIHFTHEGFDVTLRIPRPNRIDVAMEAHPSTPAALVVRTRRALRLLPAMHGMQMLERVTTGDPLIDDELELYANPVLAGFLRDRFMDALAAAGDPPAWTESLVVLKRAPGVKRFVLRFAPDRAITLNLKLRTEDLWYRATELEGILHHVRRMNDLLVHYDRPPSRVTGPGESSERTPRPRPGPDRNATPPPRKTPDGA
ncbi:MAG: hypothetical protein HY716_02555 [Planctomycetes bacterium]|nr:hypothetical protein [Planctomycetota bacterium]